MGRHRRIEEFIRKTAVKEKQKIKESVLEVFRARSKSPGGNGAFLVAGIQNEASRAKTDSPKIRSHHTGFGKKHLRDLCNATDRYALENTMSPAERRTRGRKRKSNKSKGAGIKLHKSDERLDHVQVHSDSNLRYALRSAQEQKEQQTKNAISRIASNRMTKRLGLFNQGKKSETISRAVYVCDGRRKTAEDDLQEFLNNSSTDHYSEQDKTIDKISSQKSKENEIGSVNLADLSRAETGYRSNSSTHSITPASTRQKSAPHSIVSLTSSCGSASRDDHLPSIEDIVDKVLSRVKPQKLFPDRDFVQETTDELRRIMRRNALRSCTPTPLLRTCTSIKRSLWDRYPPPRKDENKENVVHQENEVLPSEVNLMPKIEELKQPKQYVQIPTSPKRTCTSKSQTFYSSPPKLLQVQKQCGPFFCDLSDIQSDAQTLLQCHDQMIAEANRYMKQVTTKTEEFFLEDLYNSDGLDILKKQDEHAQRLQERDSRRSKEQDSWRTLFPEQSEVQPSSQDSSLSSGYQGSQILKDTGNCRTETVPTYSVKNQFPEFMPQFHDENYYRGNHTSGMSNKIRSLDILEILDDDEIQPHLGFGGQDKHKSDIKRDKDIIDNLNQDTGIPSRIHRDRNGNQRRSPQRGSQEEYQFCLKKPSLDTPSPPDELFKKHNFIP
ncbi:uncharacterized protein LOC125645753 isoform X2 [Ostrea edulis]|uniref:uncharacterized protein LOC125645753 isoform X2 n=1 Tax=Ostrea edulis TaxID=37623 RepID=UPI0024AEF3D5|nr:uncharacterized protein LOC125645753 isoform X2 [Ostrea edulis]